MAPYCQDCGTEVGRDDSFCANCGASLNRGNDGAGRGGEAVSDEAGSADGQAAGRTGAANGPPDSRQSPGPDRSGQASETGDRPAGDGSGSGTSRRDLLVVAGLVVATGGGILLLGDDDGGSGTDDGNAVESNVQAGAQVTVDPNSDEVAVTYASTQDDGTELRVDIAGPTSHEFRLTEVGDSRAIDGLTDGGEYTVTVTAVNGDRETVILSKTDTV